MLGTGEEAGISGSEVGGKSMSVQDVAEVRGQVVECFVDDVENFELDYLLNGELVEVLKH